MIYASGAKMKEANKVYLDNIIKFLKSKNIKAKPFHDCENEYLYYFDDHLIGSTRKNTGFLMHVIATPTRLTLQTKDQTQNYYEEWLNFCLNENGVEYAYRLEGNLLKLKDKSIKNTCNDIKKYALYWSFGVTDLENPAEQDKLNQIDKNLSQVSKFIEKNEKTK